MDGVLNINKPAGMTSHDVVQLVRRLLREKRVGHTGTLDPDATGVLVLCAGKATRIAQFLEAGEKEYRASMRLGVMTDTLDAGGRVLETREYTAPNRAQVSDVLRHFTGSIIQTPPVFSAIKVAGVPSYKLARQGKAGPLKARRVTIHAIELTGFDDPFIHIVVRCSKGVYIRSLCADIGDALGPGGHLVSLVRTRSGQFGIEKAVTLDELAERHRSGTLQEAVMPIDQALAGMPDVILGDEECRRITQGARLVVPNLPEGQDVLVRLHDSRGKLIALTRIAGRELRPEIVFS